MISSDVNEEGEMIDDKRDTNTTYLVAFVIRADFLSVSFSCQECDVRGSVSTAASSTYFPDITM